MLEEDFSWIQTHIELTEYLKTKENSQKKLIELLKSVGVSPFNDQSIKGVNDIELSEIDPFTFFCYIYKYGTKKRLRILQKIAKKLDLSYPLGEKGIPSAQPQRVWLFPYKYLRNDNEVQKLWNFFHNALKDKITDEDFIEALNIKGVGKTKLTEALFYINPKNNLPINGPVKSYLKVVLDIDPNFSNYTEYKTILEKVRSITDTPFHEISFKSWEWNNNQKKTNYWVFQGNPRIFDIEKALKDEVLTDWTVSAHKDKIKAGDKVILWITGNKPGVYALAEVTSEASLKSTTTDDHLWKEEDRNELKAGIKITHNLVENPISKDETENVEELIDLKVGLQGTNFSATEEQYEEILNLISNKNKDTQPNLAKKYWLYSPGENARKWDEYFEQGLIGLGWDEIGDLNQYNSKLEITEALINNYGAATTKSNDTTANYDFLHNMKIGDVVIVKKGRTELIGYGEITSDYFYDENRQEYQKLRKANWILKGSWPLEFSLVLKTLTDITKYESDDLNYHLYYEKLLDIMKNDKDLEKPIKFNFPLNSILYGPPGTGKTYTTVLKAASIIENREITSYDEALEIFNANLHKRIEFVTFHQNYSYEDFIQGLRPDTEDDKQLTFEKKDGIFKNIADKALKNIQASKKPKVLKKSFEDTFNLFFTPLTEGEIEEIEVKMKKVSYFITAITNKSIEFRKASGGTAHTLSINTLRKMYEAESVLDIQGLSSYYAPLLEKLLKVGKDSTGKKEIVEKKNYVIIIDEINRANISRVFGELITLIEPDKRSEGSIPLSATLPSGDTFMVPSNLFIIGTMNTADKSIALLDIALRRRFEFIPMYPKYNEDGVEVKDEEILRSINESIISEKGHDFQIGHSYFMNSNEDPYDLEKRMNLKVIPLMLEYFMNDFKAVGQILNTALKNTEYHIDTNLWPLKLSKVND